MIKKIISGGQTGADQAALDTAIKWGIPHGGWIPKGRKTEAGRLHNKYQMKEMPTDSYAKRTEQNVKDSDGTLIISHGPLSEGSEYTRRTASRYDRQYLHIDLNEFNPFRAAQKVYDWIKNSNIEILNVAGPRASHDPYIYQAVTKILVTLFHMEVIETSLPEPYKAAPFMPNTIEEAVEILVSKMPLKGKTTVAKLGEHELVGIQSSIGAYIHNRFGLWMQNEALLESCRSRLGKDEINDNDITTLIIRELWKQLRETHLLRVVK
jgi:hypothetical protein